MPRQTWRQWLFRVQGRPDVYKLQLKSVLGVTRFYCFTHGPTVPSPYLTLYKFFAVFFLIIKIKKKTRESSSILCQKYISDKLSLYSPGVTRWRRVLSLIVLFLKEKVFQSIKKKKYLHNPWFKSSHYDVTLSSDRRIITKK